jgi:hypothetical protein
LCVCTSIKMTRTKSVKPKKIEIKGGDIFNFLRSEGARKDKVRKIAGYVKHRAEISKLLLSQIDDAEHFLKWGKYGSKAVRKLSDTKSFIKKKMGGAIISASVLAAIAAADKIAKSPVVKGAFSLVKSSLKWAGAKHARINKLDETIRELKYSDGKLQRINKRLYGYRATVLRELADKKGDAGKKYYKESSRQLGKLQAMRPW